MRVFISYSSKDAEFVEKLEADLQASGIRTWRDKTDIPEHEASNTQGWRRAVDEALRECTQMVLVLSPDAVASYEVEAEWNFFLSNEKPVFPVMYRECEPAARIHMLQMYLLDSDYDDGIKRLASALNGTENNSPATSVDTPGTSDGASNGEPDGKVVVSMGRDGDYDDLDEALYDIQDDTLIHLTPGIYTIADGYRFAHTVEITGDGDPKDVVIEVRGDGFFSIVDDCRVTLTNLTIRYVGEAEVRLIDVTHGQLVVNNCRLTGNRSIYAGIVIASPKPCVVRETEVSSFYFAILLLETGSVEVDRCTVKHAGETGIRINSGARAVVRATTVQYCRRSVLVVEEKSEATVESCTIQFNQDGIIVGDGASALVEDCTIMQNDNWAVTGGIGAALSVLGSDLRENGKGAIGVDSNEKVTDRNNQK